MAATRSSPTLSKYAGAAVVLALAALSSAATLLVKGSEGHKSRPVDHHAAGHHISGDNNATTVESPQKHQPPYSAFALTLFVELLKLCVCLVVAVVVARRQRKDASNAGRAVEPLRVRALLRESLWYAVPSALYMIDNNLLYYILIYLDAATHVLLWQLKIPITAILFRILLNKPLTSLKWCALALLFSGVLTTQSSNPEIISQLATGSSSGRATGVLLVLVGVFVSAFAGVYTEWVLKRRAQHNFFVQNAMLYSWGVFFNLVGLVTRDLDRVMSDGLFIGCTWICPPIVVINAAVGFSYAVVFKYVDNIATLYAHVLSMLIIVLFSWLLFDLHLSLALLCGFATCILSLWLYHHKPEAATTLAARDGGASYARVSTNNTGPQDDVELMDRQLASDSDVDV